MGELGWTGSRRGGRRVCCARVRRCRGAVFDRRQVVVPPAVIGRCARAGAAAAGSCYVLGHAHDEWLPPGWRPAGAGWASALSTMDSRVVRPGGVVGLPGARAAGTVTLGLALGDAPAGTAQVRGSPGAHIRCRLHAATDPGRHGAGVHAAERELPVRQCVAPRQGLAQSSAGDGVDRRTPRTACAGSGPWARPMRVRSRSSPIRFGRITAAPSPRPMRRCPARCSGIGWPSRAPGGPDRRGEAAWPRYRPGAGRLMNFTEHGPIFAPHRQWIDLVLRAG